MMYCHKCNDFFLEEETVVKVISEEDEVEPPVEEEYCPNCGSDDIEQADRCEVCGEWIPPRRSPLCEDCESDANDELRGMFARFATKKMIPVTKAKAILLEQIARRY